ncbi:MAG: Lrp/AsnC family transcriptional regulator [Canibacter sp.]
MSAWDDNGDDRIDSLDRAIIERLRTNGRRSFSEIARELNYSEPTVRHRYNTLVDIGVIRVIGMYNELTFGQLKAQVGIRVLGERLREVTKILAADPLIVYVAMGIGTFDIVIDIVADSAEEYSDLLLHRLRRIRGIADLEVLTVLKILKDDYRWEQISI